MPLAILFNFLAVSLEEHGRFPVPFVVDENQVLDGTARFELIGTFDRFRGHKQAII